MTVAVLSTALAIPLLLVEVAGGADASPDPRPAAFITDQVIDTVVPALPLLADQAPVPRAVVALSGDDLAASRLIGVFSKGDELRAAAAAEADEAARLIEEERLRLNEEREAAAEEARRAELERLATERAAQRAAEIAAAEAAADPEPTPAPAGGPSAAQWQALRQCESDNNYQAISPNRLYYGAYQFYQGTWDNTARNAGRSDLVGVRPDQASPADQDAMAQALYRSRGDRPWPHCGAHLR